MKIIRYTDSTGTLHYGALRSERSAVRCTGDLHTGLHETGETVQNWNTDDMIFSLAQIIAFLSGSNTLPAGTVILTGTPHGVGMASKPPRWLKPGDEVSIEIDRIGRLTNPVILEA